MSHLIDKLPVSVLRVGVIQTSLDANVAWSRARYGQYQMVPAEAHKAWREVREAFRQFSSAAEKVDVVLIPELALPRSRIGDLTRLAKRLNTIVIAGVDYDVDRGKKIVRNQALLLVPRGKGIGSSARRVASYFVGKTYAAPKEQKIWAGLGIRFLEDPVVVRMDSRRLGAFGIVVCYDLLDLERAFLYRGRIQHLFVIAYNRDITSHYHLAEAYARTLYANIVVCNTGYYGGSVAVAPYALPWFRMVYRHEGQRLLTSQVFDLPVQAIIEKQNGLSPSELDRRGELKEMPPGFGAHYVLNEKAIK